MIKDSSYGERDLMTTAAAAANRPLLKFSASGEVYPPGVYTCKECRDVCIVYRTDVAASKLECPKCGVLLYRQSSPEELESSISEIQEVYEGAQDVQEAAAASASAPTAPQRKYKKSRARRRLSQKAPSPPTSALQPPAFSPGVDTAATHRPAATLAHPGEITPEAAPSTPAGVQARIEALRAQHSLDEDILRYARLSEIVRGGEEAWRRLPSSVKRGWKKGVVVGGGVGAALGALDVRLGHSAKLRAGVKRRGEKQAAEQQRLMRAAVAKRVQLMKTRVSETQERLKNRGYLSTMAKAALPIAAAGGGIGLNLAALRLHSNQEHTETYPMKSQAQRRFLHATHPKMAEEWEEHTPKGAHLPEHISKHEFIAKYGIPAVVRRVGEAGEKAAASAARRKKAIAGLKAAGDVATGGLAVASPWVAAQQAQKEAHTKGKQTWKPFKTGMLMNAPWIAEQAIRHGPSALPSSLLGSAAQTGLFTSLGHAFGASKRMREGKMKEGVSKHALQYKDKVPGRLLPPEADLIALGEMYSHDRELARSLAVKAGLDINRGIMLYALKGLTGWELGAAHGRDEAVGKRPPPTATKLMVMRALHGNSYVLGRQKALTSAGKHGGTLANTSANAGVATLLAESVLGGKHGLISKTTKS
jgi:hypothetical protein